MEGWVKLHRQITDHWAWQEKPYSKGQAWMDLILTANHEKKKIVLGNELIEIDRGSFITSEIKLMDRWGWSKSKVRLFLELLQKDTMIVKKTDSKKTTLTVLKYELYQGKEITKEPKKNRKKTAKRLQKDTNKNEKNNTTTTTTTTTTATGKYLNEISPTPSETVFKNIQNELEHFDEETVCYAIEKAVLAEKRNWNYIQGILNNWRQKGIKTLEQAKAEQKPKIEQKPVIHKPKQSNKFQNFEQDKPDFDDLMKQARENRMKEFKEGEAV